MDVRPVAIGALAVFEGLGYLHRRCHRRKRPPARGAVCADRRADREGARARLHRLAVETLTMLEHSMRNLERAGFRVAYEKEIYEWSPTTMRSGSCEAAAERGQEGGSAKTKSVTES